VQRLLRVLHAVAPGNRGIKRSRAHANMLDETDQAPIPK
jgi:hypothetical protein